jgi:hypothetical protein
VFGEIADLPNRDRVHDVTNDNANVNFEGHRHVKTVPSPIPPGFQSVWDGEPPKPATGKVWKRLVCKGEKLLAQMSWSDYDVVKHVHLPGILLGATGTSVSISMS